MFITYMEINGKYAVWDNGARSGRMVETDCVDLVVAGPTELIIDPIAQQLDFSVTKGHHMTGSELVWPPEVTTTSRTAMLHVSLVRD